MKIANCVATGTIAASDYFYNKGDKFRLPLAQAVRLENCLILNVMDDDGPAQPIAPKAGNMAAEGQYDRSMMRREGLVVVKGKVRKRVVEN
jgi:hypothetical protein